MAGAYGVGTGRSAHAWADALGEIAARSETVEIRMRHEPAAYQRKLITALGGVIVIDPSAPVCCPDCKGGDVSATTAPPVLNCRGCGHPFRQHAFGGDCTLTTCDCARFVVADDANGNGHQAADAEPQQQATETVVWTRDEIVDRIKQWADDHGEPPTRAQWEGPTTNDRPNMQLVAKRFGAWGDAIVAAGFPRPTKGTRRGSPLARTPKPPAKARTPDVSAAPEERQARPQPARAELKPPAPPPVVVVDAAPTIQITTLGVALGRWQLYRRGNDCSLDFGNGHSVEGIEWDQLAQLPALIAAVGQAFGATDD